MNGRQVTPSKEKNMKPLRYLLTTVFCIGAPLASATIVDVPVFAIAPGVNEAQIAKIVVTINGATSNFANAGISFAATTGYFDSVTLQPIGGGLTTALRTNDISTPWNEATQAGFTTIVNKQPAPLFSSASPGIAAWGIPGQNFDQITYNGTLGKLSDPDSAQYDPGITGLGTVLDLVGVFLLPGNPDVLLSQNFINANAWSIRAYDANNVQLPLGQRVEYFPYTDPRALALTDPFFACDVGSPSTSVCAGAALVQLIPLTDTDGDTIPDSLDNCKLVANSTQCNSDSDIYGNRCDGDLNNNNSTNAQDTTLFRAQLGQSSSLPLYNKADINCSGAVNAQDTTLFRQLLGRPPGPSGLGP
jgi:hypothetical protein